LQRKGALGLAGGGDDGFIDVHGEARCQNAGTVTDRFRFVNRAVRLASASVRRVASGESHATVRG
jgi:hypothetical protein